MIEEDMIKYINEEKIASISFYLPFEKEQEDQEAEKIISNLMKLEQQGYDICKNFNINIYLNPKSELDCQRISYFFEKYKGCHFFTVQDKTLKNILNSDFKSNMIEILQKSNIIYNDELENINQEFLNKFQIQSIIIGTDRKGKDRFSNPISIEQYEEIIKITKRITKDLPEDNEKLKFFEIEQRLASILAFNIQDQKDKKNRNLECLLQGKAVCMGFAVALAQICSLVGIECRVVMSLKQGQEHHIYNQVKIDGVWYNTDLTWNVGENLKYGVMPRFFLLSDKTFQDRCNEDMRAYHCTQDELAIKCNTDMPLSMEEVEMCTKNLRKWEKLNTLSQTIEDEISIE